MSRWTSRGLRILPGGRRLPRVHVILEIVETLPFRLRRRAAGSRRIDRWLDELEFRDVPRAIGKDRAGLDADDQLRARHMREQRIIAADRGGAVDAQPPGLFVQVEEQQSDRGVDRGVAQL